MLVSCEFTEDQWRLGAGNRFRENGNYSKSLELFSKAIAEHPDNENAYNGRALTYIALKDYGHALTDLNKAIAINSKFFAPYSNRAGVWEKTGEYYKAINDCKTAIELEPDNYLLYNVYSFLLATSPDEKLRNPKMSIVMAQKAIALKNRPDNMEILAIAYASAGEFDKAIDTQVKAIQDINKNQNYKENLPTANNRLQRFRQNKPWHYDRNE